MVSIIDLAVSISIFVIFISAIVLITINFFSNYRSQANFIEYQSIAYTLYNYLFSNKGIPKNWEDSGKVPVVPGLVIDLYRLSFSVKNNGSDRNNSVIGVNINFDEECEKKAWISTLVLYSSLNNTINFGIQNANFCSSQYIKNATIVFNDSFSANQTKYYYLYYSDDKNITNNISTFPSAYDTNMTITIYPEEKLKTISISKFNALTNQIYENIVQLIGSYGFAINITKLSNKLSYGYQPSSTINRGAIEIPMIVQDSDGLIKVANVNIIVYKRV
jgi:hypothetical protein